jgi:hypothetical protein
VSRAGSPFGDPEAAIAGYLDAEQDVGRISPATDTRLIAFTLLGSVHHLFLSSGLAPPASYADRARRSS